MNFRFYVRIKWIRLKAWIFELLSIEREHPFIDRRTTRLSGLLLVAGLLLSSCGSIQVGVEQTETTTVTSPVAVAETAAPDEKYAQETPAAQRDGPGPDIYWMPYGAGLYDSDEVIIADDGIAGLSESPVTFEIFFDYSPVSGRIAYGSEFWHAAEGSNVSVSDLWIFDYASGEERQLLADNVGRAVFSSVLSSGMGSDRLAAVVYDTETDRFDLALVDEQGNLEILASCASHSFSWSPDGGQIAYEARVYTGEGSPAEDCSGIFVVSLEDRSVTRISEAPPSGGGWHGDQPIWAEGQNALLLTFASPESVFAVVPLDGSGAYVVEKADSIPVEYLPNPMLSLWSPEHNSVIGQTEGMMDPFGVWVYQFSEDMRMVEEAYRIEIEGRPLDLQLIGWWEPGESVLLRDLSNLSELNPLGRALVWSLEDRSWRQIADNMVPVEVQLHREAVRSGVDGVDRAIEAFLSGDRDDRLALLETIPVECVIEESGVGPPRCPAGTAEGTELTVFPYRLYGRTEYAARDELSGLLDFELMGLYAVHAINGGFEQDWWPAGDYKIVFASTDNDHAVEVIVDRDGNVIRIEFSERTPVEILYGYSGEYLVAPVD